MLFVLAEYTTTRPTTTVQFYKLLCQPTSGTHMVPGDTVWHCGDTAVTLCDTVSNSHTRDNSSHINWGLLWKGCLCYWRVSPWRESFYTITHPHHITQPGHTGVKDEEKRCHWRRKLEKSMQKVNKLSQNMCKDKRWTNLSNTYPSSVSTSTTQWKEEIFNFRELKNSTRRQTHKKRYGTSSPSWQLTDITKTTLGSWNRWMMICSYNVPVTKCTSEMQLPIN